MIDTARPHLLLRRAIVVLALIIAVGATLLLLGAEPAWAQQQPGGAGGGSQMNPQLAGWAFMAAAVSAGLAALGAGYAVARVGSAAVGAIAEKPELFGRALVLVGLAEGIAIYGLIVSILILNKLGGGT